MMKKNKVSIILFVIFALCVSLYLTFDIYPDIRERKFAFKGLEARIRRKTANFKGQTAILIKDLDNSWRFSYNEDKLFPSASVVKVPIMLACFYAADEGKINLEERLCLKNSDKVTGSGILKNTTEGRQFTVSELIELMIVESDNTAANMLVDRLGFEYLNRLFKKMGLRHTNISRKMMHFKYRKKGIENYTTAKDMAYILEKIYRKEFLNRDVSEKCLELLKRQKIRDRIPSKLPAFIVTANKTGLERRICHDVGIVFTPKGNFLICVLTRHSYKTAKTPKAFISWLALQVYKCYQSF